MSDIVFLTVSNILENLSQFYDGCRTNCPNKNYEVQ